MGRKKRFLLRIDPELHAAIERWAADEFRSVNAQIEYCLRDAARRAGRLRRRGEGGHGGGSGEGGGRRGG